MAEVFKVSEEACNLAKENCLKSDLSERKLSHLVKVNVYYRGTEYRELYNEACMVHEDTVFYFIRNTLEDLKENAWIIKIAYLKDSGAANPYVYEWHQSTYVWKHPACP